MSNRRTRRSQERISVEPVWRTALDTRALALAVLAFARQLAAEAELVSPADASEEAPDA
ncbi:MAG TPA: hypothetical protein VHB02_03875 [Acidimicrobiales bacterium]|nr:hypothetical protein [Acidimicrobiales bacterium]